MENQQFIQADVNAVPFNKRIFGIYDTKTGNLRDIYADVDDTLAVRRYEAFLMSCPFAIDDFELLVLGLVDMKSAEVDGLPVSEIMVLNTADVKARVIAYRQQLVNSEPNK